MIHNDEKCQSTVIGRVNILKHNCQKYSYCASRIATGRVWTRDDQPSIQQGICTYSQYVTAPDDRLPYRILRQTCSIGWIFSPGIPRLHIPFLYSLGHMRMGLIYGNGVRGRYSPQSCLERI